MQLIVGPMFAGKTTEMLRRVRRFAVARRKTLIVKYNEDGRYGTGIEGGSEKVHQPMSTHDKHRADAVPCSRLADLRLKVKLADYDW